MDFEDIAKELGITKKEAIQAYKTAMRKLTKPTKKNRKFWDYVNTITETPLNRDGIISATRD
jgi:hypothetical protein